MTSWKFVELPDMNRLISIRFVRQCPSHRIDILRGEVSDHSERMH